jgi:UDP-2,3-diacylglucosamine pyrophosphatase LpxH
VNFIGEFEAAIVRYAQQYGVEALLCGHIHNAGIRQIGTITYYNCGDWVESCAALVENFDGEMELLSFCPHALATSVPTEEEEPAGALT